MSADDRADTRRQFDNGAHGHRSGLDGAAMVRAGDVVDAPIEVQIDAFTHVLRRNRVLMDVLGMARVLDLPNWYLTAGALVQTVWNVLAGAPVTVGIRDYDLFYFDDSDRSWDHEDRAIRRAARAFAGHEAAVEVRNEARVHLWYEDHFGVPCEPFAGVEHAIRSFASTTTAFGVRLNADDGMSVYAPFGFTDLFAMVLRPNPVVAPREVYEAKAARWVRQWPTLRVMPWLHDTETER